jgi:hypothetical protein
MANYDDPYSPDIVSNGMKWWKSNKQDLHTNVFAYVGHLEQNQAYKSSDNLRYMRLYGNYEMLGLDSYSYTRVETSYNVTHRVTLNVIQSIIDTVISKMAKNKPKPMFLTDGGDFSLQQKAKKLTKFMEGTFNSCEFYKKALQAMKDACIFGTGAVKFYKEDGNIKCERVFIDEIKVDDQEAFYSTPRQIHQEKYVHKSVLKEMFPDHADFIDTANDNTSDMNVSSAQKLESIIKVIESWHLPSGKTHDDNGNELDHDGLHSISIANKTLFSEKYNKKHFPFVFFRWNEKPIGFWGLGLSEQLQGIQLEINKILRTIQVSMHLCSIPKILVEASSKVVTAHLNNKIGGIIKYAGTPPKYEPLGGVPGELFTHLDRLYERAYEISGVSMLSARSEKPGGIESGKALREFNDIESERFMEVMQRYERSFIDAAEICVAMAREIYEDLGEYKTKVKGKNFIETIDWSEVDMEEDKYAMDIFPTDFLSNTPSGRLSDVQDLVTAGFIGKDDALKLLDFPDLESTLSLMTASTEDIDRMLELMLDKGKYQTPEPYQNLEMGIKKCQQAYLRARAQGAPDDRLELLRRWMEDAQALLLKAAQGSTPPPPMPQQSVPVTNATPEEVPAVLQAEIAENANLGAPEAPLPQEPILPES